MTRDIRPFCEAPPCPVRPGAALAAAALAAGALALLCGTCRRSGNRNVPEPAREVDLQRYLGRWYEIARYDSSFERGCEAVTADYSLLADGRLRVLNTCHQDGPHGKVRAEEGRAKVVRHTGGAKLKVSFFGPFYVGDYWVLDRADDYAWAIVGEPSGKYLWLLSREARPDEATRALLLGKAAAMGYDTSLLRMTRQP
ncbi:lipocalin family protein [Cupriavidus sp. 30B13]|uniref:lipocalin family protein n=1 Tax=Cupriavidus sp. 30B13 TaxID=3384241 RepID=UPI003B91A7D2